MSVEMDANPERAEVCISPQLIPPPKPPFPDPMNRKFHCSGKKSPKLKFDVGLEITFTVITHRGGRFVAGFGNAGDGDDHVPFWGISVAFVIVACEGRKGWRACVVQGRMGPEKVVVRPRAAWAVDLKLDHQLPIDVELFILALREKGACSFLKSRRRRRRSWCGADPTLNLEI